MNVTGKVVIVTGASSGIGLAVSRLLAKQGAHVALIARSKGKLDSLVKELPDSYAVCADMTKEAEIKDMVKKVKNHFGRIDILINNAGRGYNAPVEYTNITKFRKVFNLNLVGPIIAMQQIIPIMKKQKKGLIINISSGTALMFLPNMSAYSSLKRALVGVSLTAREELKRENIQVSVVYPYITLTEFEKNTMQDRVNFELYEGHGPFHAPDSAEYIAQKILDGIISEEAEIYAHEWMKR